MTKDNGDTRFWNDGYPRNVEVENFVTWGRAER